MPTNARPSIPRIVAGIAADYAYVLGRRITATLKPRAPLPGDGTPPGSRGRPVVILPGIFESWHYLQRIVEGLSAAGHPVYVVGDIGINGRPIPATARRVYRYLVAHDLRDAILVAHSKGGLVGKHVMLHDAQVNPGADLPGRRRVAHLIAVNTPWRGSELARYGVGAWREFAPRRPVMALLSAESDVDARITAIDSAIDQYVPRDSAPSAATRIPVPLVGHFRVLAHPSVVALIVDRVREISRTGGGVPRRTRVTYPGVGIPTAE
ncbi:esterase/lipase family protein [Microcella sp.]|uniref:esterase/lipase family protein n=1 Tax=Microcella sp. TaxID=1913979 RepID=UPI00391D6AF8